MTSRDREVFEFYAAKKAARIARQRESLPTAVLEALDAAKIVNVYFIDDEGVRFFIAEESRPGQSYSYDLAGDAVAYECRISRAPADYPERVKLSREQALALASLMNEQAKRAKD